MVSNRYAKVGISEHTAAANGCIMDASQTVQLTPSATNRSNAEEERKMTTSDLTTFQFNGQKTLRTILDDNDEPWFVASDVCDVLELDNVSRVLSRLDSDEKRQQRCSNVNNTYHELWVVNESGLYNLIFTSRKEEAKRFKKWVTSEVLPALRKTGSYTVKPLSPAHQLLMAAQQLVEHEERLRQVEERVEQLHTAQLALSGGENFYTIKGYFHVKKLGAIDHTTAQRWGFKAAKLSREKGVQIGKAFDPLYGEINTYAESVLVELIGGVKCLTKQANG